MVAGEADRGKRGRWGQARLVGASEAGGGKRGWWGQARLVGAGEANGGRKLPGQIPSQQDPLDMATPNRLMLDMLIKPRAQSNAELRHDRERMFEEREPMAAEPDHCPVKCAELS